MEKIEELFKKFIYTGVGLVSLTKDKLQSTIEKMIKEEKISEKEGKKIIDEFFKNTEAKKQELETQLKSVVDKAITKFNFASSADLEKLKTRVEILEKLLAKK
ncbi:MAG: hypothetical protein JXR51_08535 [Bacteroidales bacterium]|nr:hypothetical protein [Bacteroidales bacterium]MBN2757209.1 hypothetical protein [Bacteroidales bacterium]